MAIRYIVADDLDGTTATVETHHFSLDGVDYQIDLSQDNYDQLAAALAPFIAAGRRPARNTKPQPQRGAAGKNDRAARAQIRAWWAQHWQSNDLPEPRGHGVIPTRVRDAYHAAHPST